MTGELKSFRMPVRFGEAAFTFIFEKFVNGRENDAGAFGIDADVEIKFVVEKINVAPPDHVEKFPGDIEIVGVNDSVLNREAGGGVARDAIASSRHDVIQDS